MKTYYFFIFSLFLFTVQIQAQDPTDAGIPDANHVLVVYNGNSSVSDSVMNYYVDARGIPNPLNVVRLDSLVDKDVTIDGSTHRVKIVQVTDIIQDSVNNANNVDWTTKHAFKYFLDNIATPIKTHLVNNNLLYTIRYIVLCKGVPFKIQGSKDSGDLHAGNLTVDGLLCMLNTPNYNAFILNTVINSFGLSNPYNDVDPNFTMEYRFIPDHFIAQEGHHLSYLVSHLDGVSYEVVKSIINKSIDPDMSGTATWIIDGDLSQGEKSEFVNARNILEELGFNVVYDFTDDWITSYEGDVIGYTSHGTHAEDGNCEWEDSAWVKDYLHFNLANGSVFNTYESFNGNSLTTLKWRYCPRIPPNCNHTQGLATQFTEIGGTGTMGHAWEPGGGAIVKDQIFFPAYQVGYSLIDAFYQGLPILAWQNFLVGDPLVRIYDCENTVFTSNTTIGSGEYECDVIIPPNVTLIIESGSVVNFRRNASLKVYGTLIIESNDTINFSGYSELIIDSTGTITQNSGSWLVFKGKSRFIMNNDLELTSSNNFIFKDESRFYVNASLTLAEGAQLNMSGNSLLIINDKMTIGVNAQVNLNNNSNLKNYGKLTLNSESTLNINSISNFNSYGKVYLFEGANINLNTESVAFKVSGGVFKSLGNVNNPVTINCSVSSTASQLSFNNIDTLQLYYTTIKHCYISLNISDEIHKPRLITITNSIIDSSSVGNIFGVQNTEGVDVTLLDNEIYSNDNNGTGITFSGFNGVQLERNVIQNLGTGLGGGINTSYNQSIEIIECEILNFKDGIKQGRVRGEETDEEIPENIHIYDCTVEGRGYNQGTGISIGYDLNVHTTGVKIESNNISDFNSCIAINNPDHFPILIKNNMISNYNAFGISISGGMNSLVKSNEIIANEPAAYNCIGIFISQDKYPFILENTITASGVTEPGTGLVMVSSSGEIRKNTIQYHRYGIEIGGSAPKLGANIITDNNEYGIYISRDSYSDLSEAFVGEEQYPLSGYNTIRENGVCNLMNYSELYLVRSGVNLEKGCNTVADDREEPLNCGYYYLIDGEGVDDVITANRNYWGEVNGGNPEGRFGESITVNYEDWLGVPCTYGQGETELILVDSKGEVFDTVYSTGNSASNLTDLESRYATANEYFYSSQYSQAKQEYEGIIQNYGNDRGSLQAYNRLYSIANLMNSSPETFSSLKDFYLEKAGSQSDSLMIGALTHLSDLCLVSAEEYIPAISNFDLIAQQNPNTDIALYSQIDALTTALMLPSDSTMNKGILGKYSVNGLSDYTNKLSELIKTRGKSGLESEKELLPTEYTLYQNYPNPFNPITTIKYDLPNAGNVSLVIYDILGKRVKELVNTKQQSGRYEIQFDASNLATGVYIYQFITDKYINSKKMILLK